MSKKILFVLATAVLVALSGCDQILGFFYPDFRESADPAAETYSIVLEVNADSVFGNDPISAKLVRADDAPDSSRFDYRSGFPFSGAAEGTVTARFLFDGIPAGVYNVWAWSDSNRNDLLDSDETFVLATTTYFKINEDGSVATETFESGLFVLPKEYSADNRVVALNGTALLSAPAAIETPEAPPDEPPVPAPVLFRMQYTRVVNIETPGLDNQFVIAPSPGKTIEHLSYSLSTGTALFITEGTTTSDRFTVRFSSTYQTVAGRVWLLKEQNTGVWQVLVHVYYSDGTDQVRDFPLWVVKEPPLGTGATFRNLTIRNLNATPWFLAGTYDVRLDYLSCDGNLIQSVSYPNGLSGGSLIQVPAVPLYYYNSLTVSSNGTAHVLVDMNDDGIFGDANIDYEASFPLVVNTPTTPVAEYGRYQVDVAGDGYSFRPVGTAGY